MASINLNEAGFMGVIAGLTVVVSCLIIKSPELILRMKELQIGCSELGEI